MLQLNPTMNISTTLDGPVSARAKQLVCVVLVAALGSAGCGTIFTNHRGQPGGKISPGIAILDGLLLLLFIIPGVIAFAVDFSTGAIYASNDSRIAPVGPQFASRQLPNGVTAYYVPTSEMTKERIEAVLSAHAGRKVTLDDPSLRVQPTLNGRVAYQHVTQATF